jgi:hypothetical protein
VEAATVLSSVEEIYLASLDRGWPPPDFREQPMWASEVKVFSMQLWLRAARLESPFHVLLELPWPAYGASFAGFALGLAHVFGVPLKGPAKFEQAREDFWKHRLEADKAKQEWLDWKREQVERHTPFRLKEMREATALPPPDDAAEAEEERHE